jgi:hypothetical protein
MGKNHKKQIISFSVKELARVSEFRQVVGAIHQSPPMNLPPSNSRAFELDLELMTRWLRASAIIALPALVSLATALQSGEPVSLGVIFGTLAASAADLLRRYANDYSIADDACDQE